MKVLHINSYYGYGKFYKNLYDLQVKEGLDLDVFVSVDRTFQGNDFDYGNYTSICINHNKNDRFIFHLKHYKILKDLEQRFDIETYSLSHAHSLFSNGYIAMKLKEKFGIPYVVAVRNADVNVFFKRMIHLRKMGIHIMDQADKIIFLSKTYRDFVIRKYIPEDLHEAFFKKSEIIPNGIDQYWFDHQGTVKDLKKTEDIHLLQIGDLNRNKNITTTAKAIKRLIDNNIGVHLDVVGKIKDQRVFDEIKDLEFITYLGYQSKEALLEIYRNNDIFILPSIHESFGLVYAEAMSQGLPVLYTRGQGFDGHFKDGEVGFSINPLDETEIAARILDIIPELKTLSKHSIERVNKFKWEHISSIYMDLYNQVISGQDKTLM